MAHYHGHRKRLRARLEDAPEKLNDYEILELLLGYVLLRCDTKPVAKELLSRFGTLQGVVQARPEQYLDIPGLGEGVAGFFRLLREFLPRYLESPLRSRDVLCDPENVGAIAKERLGSLAHEEVWIAFTDNSNRLMAWEKLAQGSIGFSAISTRDIFERAITLKATGFILVHNHPGGNPTPSEADHTLTEHIKRASQTLCLRFADHVVVSENGCFSIMGNRYF